MKTRKNLTRVLAALLVLVMLMCAVGCSKGENTTGSADNTQGTSNNNPGNTISGDNTDTTVSNDGTIGGDNTGTTAPEDDEPEFYVLSGVWKINGVMVNTIPEDERAQYNGGFEADISFTSNGKVFDNITWSYFGLLDMISFTFMSFERDDFADLYFEQSWREEASDYMILDFGNIPQEVTRDFYTWFTANATKQ